MDEGRIARVREMEDALNRWVDLGNRGEALLEAMTADVQSLERLIAYYSSPQWQRDYEDSNRGLFPEDPVFDLLTQLHGLVEIVQTLDHRLEQIH